MSAKGLTVKSSRVDPNRSGDSEEDRAFWDHGWLFRLSDRIPDGPWFRGSITIIALVALLLTSRGWPTDAAELRSTALWIGGIFGGGLILVTPAAIWMRASSKEDPRSARTLKILAVVSGVAAVGGVVFGLWILGQGMEPGQRSFGETLSVGLAIFLVGALLWPGTWLGIVAFPYRAIRWIFLRRRCR